MRRAGPGIGCAQTLNPEVGAMEESQFSEEAEPQEEDFDAEAEDFDIEAEIGAEGEFELSEEEELDEDAEEGEPSF
jgi:hypothetical protein